MKLADIPQKALSRERLPKTFTQSPGKVLVTVIPLVLVGLLSLAAADYSMHGWSWVTSMWEQAGDIEPAESGLTVRLFKFIPIEWLVALVVGALAVLLGLVVALLVLGLGLGGALMVGTGLLAAIRIPSLVMSRTTCDVEAEGVRIHRGGSSRFLPYSTTRFILGRGSGLTTESEDGSASEAIMAGEYAHGEQLVATVAALAMSHRQLFSKGSGERVTSFAGDATRQLSSGRSRAAARSGARRLL